jgi:hypothetical protein
MRWFCIAIVGTQVVLSGVGDRARAEIPQTNLEVRAETSVGAVLGNMSSRASVVFVGQVESIKRTSGAVEITFRVDRAVLGQLGSRYTLREWLGLWVAGQQRYRVGQRAMVFLHGANAAGLSSPVDGMQGVVPLVPMGANAEPLLDIRWLETRVVRTMGASIADADNGAISLSDAISLIAQSNRPSPGPVNEPVKLPLPVGVRPVAVPVKTFGVVAEKDSMGDAHETR